MAKKYKLSSADIVTLVKNHGGCIATDRIMVDGEKVGFMYRDEPDNEVDSGWRFLAGDEEEDYMDNDDHHGAYDVNTLANYDRDIIPHLNAPVGSSFVRVSDTEFELLEDEEDED